ncbi:MAG TPA: ATP-binding protein [Defluviitaleaceae bacterium]|nr:ATP-binding protein [Defluviitaleaceae bacterium]
MEAQVTISGGIIGELSEKIPSNIIALNELIKNSYDAGASKVIITLDSHNKTLTIVDNGCGMDQDSINILFHISKSEKTYGVKNKYGRYTQGSKGLGFLSVFKFGKNVCWITKKDKGLKFRAQYDTLINSDNISLFAIPIEHCPEAEKGTKIIIELEEYSAKSLISYLSDLSNLQKVIYSFEDNSFEIVLNIDGKSYSSVDRPSLTQIYPERQLYYIKYNSQEQAIKFYHNDILILNYDYLFNASEYEIDIEIVIYQLKSRGKKHIIPLYYNPQGDLTPLIYVNTNLFNNFNIFDPNIMKNIKTSDVLNQMIGSIRIFSNSKLLSFNSDRTQFLQNVFTDNIKEFLQGINKTIQIIGSKYKKHLLDFDILTRSSLPSNYLNDNNFLKSIIKDQFAFRDEVKIDKIDTKVVYSFANKKAYAVIQRVNNLESSDLSQGEIPKSDVSVKGIDRDEEFGKEFSAPPIEEHGLIQPGTPVRSSSRKEPLITSPAHQGYKTSFNASLSNLINQINTLAIDRYTEVLSCSLRATFELSVDLIKKCSKYNSLRWKNDLAEDAKIIILHIKNDNNFKSEIAKNTMIDYKSLCNMIKSYDNDIDIYIPKLHLGAHKSTLYLSKDDIVKLGKMGWCVCCYCQ